MKQTKQCAYFPFAHVRIWCENVMKSCRGWYKPASDSRPITPSARAHTEKRHTGSNNILRHSSGNLFAISSANCEALFPFDTCAIKRSVRICVGERSKKKTNTATHSHSFTLDRGREMWLTHQKHAHDYDF